jgi:hypothetical protein
METEVSKALKETLEDSVLRCKSLGLDPDKYSTVIKAKVVLSQLENEKHFLDMTKEEQEELNEKDLREMALYHGGWDKLKEVIAMLEDNDNEAAWERHCTDY